MSSATPAPTSAATREIGAARRLPRRALLGGGALVALTAAGCARKEASSSASASASSAPVIVRDPWAKAAKKGAMTAVFGTIANTTDAPITLTAARSSAASMVQLHETASNGKGGMSMKEKKGGFTIPARSSLALAPGGNHIMLMGLTQDLAAGSKVSVELVLDGGRTLRVDAVVRDYAGAKENYGASDGGGEHDMHHGDHEKHHMDHGSMASDGGH